MEKTFILITVGLFLFVCQHVKQWTFEGEPIRQHLIKSASDISDHSLSGKTGLKDWQGMWNGKYNEWSK